MSSRPHSSSRNLNESNCDSNDTTQSRHSRNVRLEEQNNRYRHNYLPFTIPSSYYNIIHVHRFTTIDTIFILIDHFESCYRYSIDTESDRNTYDLSLIQVHSIPQHLPSFIVLFELNHFPAADSLLMVKIKLLFSLLFRLGNILFSWGPMSEELKFAVQMNLFTWPVSALLVNLQNEFFCWYLKALPSCKACGRVYLRNMASFTKPRCICSSNFPYSKLTDKWSLQNAIRYTVNRFLDKSSTRRTWSIMLDQNYSPLSSFEQRRRLNYAIYDCFAVTFLHRAIDEKWTLIELREAELISLFTSNASPRSSSLPTTTVLEDISDDEHEEKLKSSSISNAPHHSSSLLLSTFLENISEDDSEDSDEVFLSSTSTQHVTNTSANFSRNVELPQASIPDDTVTDPVLSNQPLSNDTKPRLRRTHRSQAARVRRNRKHNQVIRPLRDRHIILRHAYHRFNHKQIKHILRKRGVYHVHVKINKVSQLVSIGMKKAELVDLYFARIPGNLFDKDHYQQYYR